MPTVVITVFTALLMLMVLSNASGDPRSSYSRTPVEGVVWDNDCVVDETGWISNVGKASRNLKHFYEKTGVQPFVYLKAYDPALTSDAEKEAYAEEWYDAHISNEGTFLFVYFGERDLDNDVVAASRDSAGRDLEKCRSDIAEYRAAAENALRSDDEDAARRLIASKQEQEAKLPDLESAYEAACEDADEMARLYNKLAGDIKSLEDRRDVIKRSWPVNKKKRPYGFPYGLFMQFYCSNGASSSAEAAGTGAGPASAAFFAARCSVTALLSSRSIASGTSTIL